MSKGLIFFGGLLVGGAGAAFVTRAILKPRYEQKMEEEVAACRELYLELSDKLRDEASKKEAEEKKEAAKEAVKTYSAEPEKAEKVIDEADKKKPEEKPPMVIHPSDIFTPYVIPPDVFDAPDNPHKCIGFTRFIDGIVCDEDYEPLSLEELDNYVGRESLLHFGEYEPDRVCIRNERLQIDYEICLRNEYYSHYIEDKPDLQRYVASIGKK